MDILPSYSRKFRHFENGAKERERLKSVQQTLS